MKDRQLLIIFTRFPVAGQTKTRLIPALGPWGAAQLQRRMTERIAKHALHLANTMGVGPIVYFCGGSDEQVANWLGPEFTYHRQSQGDIGQRMAGAFADNFARDVSNIVLTGSDIPDLNQTLLKEAFTLLDSYDTVLGPAVDGGYYLIGISSRVQSLVLPQIFSDIQWSTATVLAKTVAFLKMLGVSHTTLPELHDLDRPSDLAKNPDLCRP